MVLINKTLNLGFKPIDLIDFKTKNTSYIHPLYGIRRSIKNLERKIENCCTSHGRTITPEEIKVLKIILENKQNELQRLVSNDVELSSSKWSAPSVTVGEDIVSSLLKDKAALAILWS